MSSFFLRFKFDADKVDWKILTIMAVVWLTVTVCGVFSVLAHKHVFTPTQKRRWLLLIVLLPGLGLLAYLPFSLMREGPDVLRPADKKSSRREKKTAATTISA
ncbi:MAG: hypothetical protein RL380_265 [Verrucomicrobiota bacterium]|jgi:hypothetical protein